MKQQQQQKIGESSVKKTKTTTTRDETKNKSNGTKLEDINLINHYRLIFC